MESKYPFYYCKTFLTFIVLTSQVLGNVDQMESSNDSPLAEDHE